MLTHMRAAVPDRVKLYRVGDEVDPPGRRMDDYTDTVFDSDRKFLLPSFF